jgi:hypothetical protein
MAWDKTRPSGSSKVSTSKTGFQDNFAYLDTAIGQEHETPSSHGSTPTNIVHSEGSARAFVYDSATPLTQTILAASYSKATLSNKGIIVWDARTRHAWLCINGATDTWVREDISLGANLIRNGNFEEGNIENTFSQSAASDGPFAEETSDVNNGAYAVSYEIAGTQSGTAKLYANGDPTVRLNHIPATEGETYMCRAYFQWDGTTPGASKLRFGVEWYDEAGSIIGTADLSAAFTPPEGPAGYWPYRWLTSDAPAETAYVVPVVHIEQGAATGAIYFIDDWRCYRVSALPDTVGIKMPNLASAATVTFYEDEEVNAYKITGTTDITTITASWVGRKVTMHFAAALTVTHGSNIYLAYGRDFITVADSTMTVICDGTNWYEIARSGGGQAVVQESALASNYTIPTWDGHSIDIVTPTGTGTIDKITPAGATDVGRILVIVRNAGGTCNITDTSPGSISADGEISLDTGSYGMSSGDTLMLICRLYNTYYCWIELSRAQT